MTSINGTSVTAFPAYDINLLPMGSDGEATTATKQHQSQEPKAKMLIDWQHNIVLKSVHVPQVQIPEPPATAHSIAAATKDQSDKSSKGKKGKNTKKKDPTTTTAAAGPDVSQHQAFFVVPKAVARESELLADLLVLEEEDREHSSASTAGGGDSSEQDTSVVLPLPATIPGLSTEPLSWTLAYMHLAQQQKKEQEASAAREEERKKKLAAELKEDKEKTESKEEHKSDEPGVDASVKTMAGLTLPPASQLSVSQLTEFGLRSFPSTVPKWEENFLCAIVTTKHRTTTSGPSPKKKQHTEPVAAPTAGGGETTSEAPSPSSDPLSTVPGLHLVVEVAATASFLKVQPLVHLCSYYLALATNNTTTPTELRKVFGPTANGTPVAPPAPAKKSKKNKKKKTDAATEAHTPAAAPVVPTEDAIVTTARQEYNFI